MRTGRKWVVVVVLFVMVAALAVAPLSAQSPSAEEGILQEMAEALNDGDIDTALSYFGENAFFASMYGEPEPPLVGVEQIRGLFEGLVAGYFKIEINVVASFDDGSVLISDTETWGVPITQMGFESFHATEAYLVRGGKIQGVVWMLSNESLQGVMEVMAAAGPPITAEEIVGTWRWRPGGFYFQFRSDGTFRASSNTEDLNSDTPQDIGTYVVEDGVLYMTSGDITRYCSPGNVGTYTLSHEEDGQLGLTLQSDECGSREAPSGNVQKFLWQSEAP